MHQVPRVDERAGTYTVRTPVKKGDNPGEFGLGVGTLAGGWYRRGRSRGEPPICQHTGTGMAELQALIEFHHERNHGRNHIELWLPIDP